MWDAEQAIQFRPRIVVSGRDTGGVAIKKTKVKKGSRQVATGEKHIAFNPEKRTYKVHLNRRTMSFSKDGFITIEAARQFRDQKLALAIERPVPADLEQGDWLVTFSRPDCDHCQTMYRTHFSKPRAEKVLKVSILDVMGKPLPMPCVGCVESQVFRVRAGQPGKSPEYLLQTPAVVRLKDGVVVSVCSDIDDPAQVRETLGSPDAPAAASTPPSTNATEKPTIPPPPAAPAWPGVPAKLEAFYVAEFADAVGKPLSDNAFARLIQTPVPADFLKGRWIVVFFREDCDHCQELLMSYFTGKLPVRTATIAIPDTDPAASLGNPCEECAKLTLVKGPNYVIGTPVVLAINDGVVECVIENVDDLEALQGCLKFPK
jgi:glutaredoxin